MKVLFVASEVTPYAKTGGLADVSAALPRHLGRAGHDVRVLMPLYDRTDTSRLHLETVVPELELRLGRHRYAAKIFRGASDPEIHFLHCPALYSRGAIYTHDDDEHRRFLALSYGAIALCQRTGFAPDIVHANDWHAALLPMILKAFHTRDPLFATTRSVLTIHNLNYQGSFSSHILPDTNLAGVSHLFHQDQLRAGRVNFLLHGLLYADAVNAVSPTYAREIQGPDHGVGLDPFLRARSSTVVGILNGVDYEEWSPERDRHIPHPYSRDDLTGKELNKEALCTGLGLPYVKGIPLVGIVSRLVRQKGLDLLEAVMPDLLRRNGFQFVVLGSGEKGLEDLFFRMQRAFPRQVCFYRGFSEPLAHLIEAGADMFLMPSRYEPCGLNQLYSLRYGTVPIVHRTGGLADSVTQFDPRTGEGTGFSFEQHDAAGVRWGLEAALRTYRDAATWRRVVENGMAQDFSWEKQRKLYELLYNRLQNRQ
ncbi:MAG: glycogen synthase [Myxococcales bacterium]|nr:glycogen synthase [Myxococcales bacterium]